MDKILEFFVGEEGATMVEYALMIMFVALVCIASAAALGGSVSTMFASMAGAF